jgi:two-component system response regulator LytT
MAIDCLIIEEDQSVVDIIKKVGGDFDQIRFNHVEENHEKVLNTIIKIKPKIIFINIETNKINFHKFIFEISQHNRNNPSIIALSKTKANAYDAYQFNFSFYILKPLTEFYVRKSLHTIMEDYPTKSVETICLKSHKDFHYLNIKNILYLKADNNTTDFYMDDGKIIGAYKTLKVFENSMPKSFYRIHKSYIININCISRIQFGKWICIIKNQHKIPFTKTFLDNTIKMNEILSKNSLVVPN